MKVEDFNGSANIASANELEERLRTVRKNEYGAFILEHEEAYPCLWIHFNDENAFLYWFVDPKSGGAGFQAMGMNPSDCPEMVFFLQVGAVVADGFEAPKETVLPMSLAVEAAMEFFNTKQMPTCIQWQEL